MPALLFSQMDPPPGRDQEFADWYECDHIPARMVIKGFTGAARYQNLEPEPAHLAVYELDDVDVLQTDEYKQLKAHPSALTTEMLSTVSSFTRYTLETIADTGAVEDAAPYLFAVAFDVPAEHETEFDDWYATEHIPLLMQVPEWRRVRRLRTVGDQAGPHLTRFALHELQSLDALKAPQRNIARTTEWRSRLSDAHDWFRQNQRWTYSLISAHDPITKEV